MMIKVILRNTKEFKFFSQFATAIDYGKQSLFLPDDYKLLFKDYESVPDIKPNLEFFNNAIYLNPPEDMALFIGCRPTQKIAKFGLGYLDRIEQLIDQNLVTVKSSFRSKFFRTSKFSKLKNLTCFESVFNKQEQQLYADVSINTALKDMAVKPTNFYSELVITTKPLMVEQSGNKQRFKLTGKNEFGFEQSYYIYGGWEQQLKFLCQKGNVVNILTDDTTCSILPHGFKLNSYNKICCAEKRTNTIKTKALKTIHAEMQIRNKI